jgi:predicted nucleic acid-binding protein
VKLLVDTNVLLDVILERKAHMRESVAVLDAIEAGRAEGYVSSHAITTIHYIVAKANGGAAAVMAISDLLDLCEVVAVTEADFRRALALGLKDFEDAVQVAAALQVGVDYLVSRNEKDFRKSPIGVRSPATVAILLATLDKP